jgi:hypothetical protein
MALPGVPQSFAVENAQDMAEKLLWEIEAYRIEPDLQPKLWRAFNCAVTAWHISDWLWKERRDAGLDVGKVGEFKTAIQERSRELGLCNVPGHRWPWSEPTPPVHLRCASPSRDG